MTAPTDRETSFTWEVEYFDSGYQALPEVVNVIPSMDMDRVPYCDMRIEFEGLPYETFMKLDPRIDDSLTATAGKAIRVRLNEYDAAGDFRANLVRDVVFPDLQWADLIVREVEYDEITGDGSLFASTRESILDDRKRLSGTTVDTAAATVFDLVVWSLTDCFGTYGLSNDNIVYDTAIPAGDRRLMNPGDSHSDILEPELQAIGARLFDYWGDIWYANRRENTPLLGAGYGYDRTVQLSTYTRREGAPADADPIVYSVRSTLSRNGDYADGVLIKFDTLESGGTTTYQRSGGGENTKGRVITWNRTAPAGNAADQVVKRTKIRGRDLVITARARLDVSPGQLLNVFLRPGRTLTANVRSISWDIRAAEMTITAQAGIPED